MNKRFERHLLIPDWNQAQLSNATVIIVGMGALGNEVARILAMAGVGKLIICDPDIIETSNLSRMTFFRPQHVGQLKVDMASQALQDLYPEIKIEKRPQFLIHGIGLAELRDASLVIGCLDSQAARLQLAGRCQLVQARYIDGGTHPWGGEVRMYLDPNGSCFGCSLSPEKRAIVDEPWSCIDQNDNIPEAAAIPSSALTGTWMGMMAVRLLMNLDCPDGTIKIDSVRGTSTIVQQNKDPNCALHHPIPLENVQKLNISAKDTFRALTKSLPEQAVPLSWSPIQTSLYCSKCKHSQKKWGLPSNEKCPKCNELMFPRTTLEIKDVPDNITLETLGIAPCEIIAIRFTKGLTWVELCDVYDV
jgi:molybdopterin/thiamine biosynthesis adenylyltransferase